MLFSLITKACPSVVAHIVSSPCAQAQMIPVNELIAICHLVFTGRHLRVTACFGQNEQNEQGKSITNPPVQ